MERSHLACLLHSMYCANKDRGDRGRRRTYLPHVRPFQQDTLRKICASVRTCASSRKTYPDISWWFHLCIFVAISVISGVGFIEASSTDREESSLNEIEYIINGTRFSDFYNSSDLSEIDNNSSWNVTETTHSEISQEIKVGLKVSNTSANVGNQFYNINSVDIGLSRQESDSVTDKGSEKPSTVSKETELHESMISLHSFERTVTESWTSLKQSNPSRVGSPSNTSDLRMSLSAPTPLGYANLVYSHLNAARKAPKGSILALREKLKREQLTSAGAGSHLTSSTFGTGTISNTVSSATMSPLRSDMARNRPEFNHTFHKPSENQTASHSVQNDVNLSESGAADNASITSPGDHLRRFSGGLQIMDRTTDNEDLFDVPQAPLPPTASLGDAFTTLLQSRLHKVSTEAVYVDADAVSHLEDSSDDYHNSSTSSNGTFPGWPTKLASMIEGDLVLGGLMMVHEREDRRTCGPIMPQGGVQALEAMLYTLDMINNDPLFLPGIKLGAHILDDCDKDTYGLEMAVDFIKGSISNIDDTEYHCNKSAVRKVISGVVGAASSVTSIQVANLLRLFRIPQVSFFSTSPELSNKQRFEFFSRTIPSDHYQVKAMVEIVQRFRWSYVSIIYEESNYGIKAFEELEDLLKERNVCIAVKEKLVKDSGVAAEKAYDEIVQKLLTKPRARGAIIFGSDQEVAGVMRAVRRANASTSFSWIGSDGWSARALVSDGNEREVEGTLSVQPQAHPVKGFEEYFLNLTVENNKRNPWFVEFWEDHFHCRYPNSSRTPYNNRYTQNCTTRERLTRENTVFENQLQFVSDAVMSFAHALKEMHKKECQGRAGLCDAMRPIEGSELLKYLRKVNFTGLSGDQFKFDAQGDGPARYNIIHFKQVRPGQYRWVRVGEYIGGTLVLNMSEIQFKMEQLSLPESVCSLPCELGQAKKYVEGDICCWHCFNCTQYQIRDSRDETRCSTCKEGTVPDSNKVTCQPIPEVFLRPDSGWAIGAMAFSSSGMLLTLFVGGVFLRHHDTPVVRASGRELSFVLLTGIMLCYCVTFALVLRPTDIVCGVQRFSAGFCFTVVYAALLTKTNRIARIFKASKRTSKRPPFISPKSQLFICSGLVAVQVLVNLVWIMVSPPMARHHHPTREDNHLVCQSHIDASYMIAFGYPILLIIVCTVYAILTRKIPEAYNESKYIGFTMYTTCVIWLAFVPLYFGTGSHIPLRITSMSVTISLSASVTLACLFSPKLYIILIHPERNVRQSMMPIARYFTVKNSAATVTGNNASNSLHPAAYMPTITAPDRDFCPKADSATQQGLPLADSSTQTSLHEEVAAPSSPVHQDDDVHSEQKLNGEIDRMYPGPRSSSPFSRTRSCNSALKSRRRNCSPQGLAVRQRHHSDLYLEPETGTGTGGRARSPGTSYPSSVASSPTSSALALDETQVGRPSSVEAVVGSPGTPTSFTSAPPTRSIVNHRVATSTTQISL